MVSEQGQIGVLIQFFVFFFIEFRPEFIDFFGLHVTSSNGSPILTASASPSNQNDDDNAARANDDDTENPSTSVVKLEKKVLFPFLLSF